MIDGGSGHFGQSYTKYYPAAWCWCKSSVAGRSCSSFIGCQKQAIFIMFRLPGAGVSPDKAAIEEEKRRNRKNVWFTMKAFVAYVALLRLGKLKESSEESFSILKNENIKMKEPLFYVLWSDNINIVVMNLFQTCF